MTALADLSTDDQITLMRTPGALVMATAYAEQDGIFSLRKELKAGLQAAIDAAAAFPQNEIVQRLALEMNAIDHEEGDKVKEKAATSDNPDDLVEERNPSTSRPEALRLAAESLAIMEANATREEAVEFKYWLYAIADQVTLTSKAGGFLGMGGVRVSPYEKAFLSDLRQALDIPDDNVPEGDLPDDADAAAAERLGEENGAPVAAAPDIASLDAASVVEETVDSPAPGVVRAERAEDV